MKGWQRLSRVGKEVGLEFLIFEPMSIPRELGETIKKAKELYRRVNENSSIPFLFCLDVDHGDLASSDPQDTDPYSWLREFGYLTPCVHIKQSLPDKSSHWPFTPEFNQKGIITPQKVLQVLKSSGAKEVTLLLEISHRERFPQEYRVVDDLKKSVEYWREWVKL